MYIIFSVQQSEGSYRFFKGIQRKGKGIVPKGLGTRASLSSQPWHFRAECPTLIFSKGRLRSGLLILWVLKESSKVLIDSSRGFKEKARV